MIRYFLTLSFVVALIANIFAKVPAEFTETTFAKPPNVSYPAGLAVSPLGHVFVSSDFNSSLGRGANRGNIIRCVDTNGDGKADQFTKFVTNIDSPRGSCFVGDTLYVVHPPFLSSFRDTNGDGVADEKKVLIKGMGFDLSFRGADHTSNGVRMGIDGWLYLAIGDYGMFKAVAKDGSTMHLHGGGVLRVRRDGSELEVYTLYTRNIVDVAVSPALEVFTRDNTNDGKGWNTRFHHAIALANMGYPRLYKNFPSEHLASLADYGGGSGTGGYYLDEPGIPEKYNDKVYTCDFTTRKVYVHAMTKTEATYKTKQEVFFDKQAIDLDVDGYSRMYVSDWQGGGYNYSKPNVGSITLITPKGFKPKAFPNLSKATDEQLMKHVSANSAVLRINAQQEILKRGRKPAFSACLFKIAADEKGLLYGRIAALFTLKQLDGQKANPAIVKLASSNSLREFALRALTDRAGQLGNVPAEVLLSGLKDSNPRVRLQAIISLAKLGKTQYAKAILPLGIEKTSENGGNRAIPHIAVKAVVKLRAVEVCLKALGDPALRPVALRCCQEIHSDRLIDGLIAKLNNTSDKLLQKGILTVLFRLYHKEKIWNGKKWWGTRPDDRGPYYELTTWEQTQKIRTAIENTLPKLDSATIGYLFSEMRRNRISPEKLNLKGIKVDEALAMIENPNPGTAAIPLLMKVATDKKRKLEIRIAAFRAMNRIQGSEALKSQLEVLTKWSKINKESAYGTVIQEFIYSSKHASQAKIIRKMLSNKKQRDTSQIIIMIALNLSESPLVSSKIKKQMNGSLKNQRNNPAYILAIGELGLNRFRQDVIAASKSKNAKLKKAGQAALENLFLIDSGSGKKIESIKYDQVFSLLIKTKGDVKLGEKLFARQSCIACHTTKKDETPKGPFLGTVGGKFNRAYLIQAILKPSEIVAQGFQTQLIITEDGDRFLGFVTDEKDGVIELRNEKGEVVKIKEEEVETRKMIKVSTMPVGVVNKLTVRELASLLDYLQSLR